MPRVMGGYIETQSQERINSCCTSVLTCTFIISGRCVVFLPRARTFYSTTLGRSTRWHLFARRVRCVADRMLYTRDIGTGGTSLRHDLLFCETHPCPSTFYSGRNALVFAPGIGRARSTTSPVSLRKQAPDPPSLFSSDCSLRSRSAGTRRSGTGHVNFGYHTSQRLPLPSSSRMRCKCTVLSFQMPRRLAVCSRSFLLPPRRCP